MWLKKRYLFLIIVLSFVMTNIINVNAINTGFSVAELSENDKNTFLSNLKISLLSEEPTKKGIECFDVSNEGMVAIGQKKMRDKEICIYSSEGVFVYGYAFTCTQSFGVEWDGELINIYFVRSDVIISVDQSGKILDIKKVQNTIENNSYRNHLLYSTERTIGEKQYLLKNNMGILNWMALSYSQIIVVNANGSECIMYDMNSIQLLNTFVNLLAVLVIVATVVSLIAYWFIRLKRSS